MSEQAAAPTAATPAPASSEAPEAVEAEGAESTEQPEASKETVKAEKEMQNLVKKFKLKVDGQEYEEEIDFNDEEGLTKKLQLAKAAQKRMQEHAVLRKDLENLVQMMKTNPAKVLGDPRIGVDLKKFAQDIINQEIEDLQKTPEQREKEKLQKELEELKDQKKKEDEERSAKEFERLKEQTEQQLDNDITSALDTSGLPKTPYTVKKMADLMMVALHNNIDLSAKDLVPILKKNMTSEIREMLSVSPEEVMEELLGKDNISRLRKRNIQKIKQAVESTKDIKNTGADVKSKEPEAPKKIAIKDFLNGKF